MSLVVIYNGIEHLWVNTISLNDGIGTPKAILISLENGKVLIADIENIKVVQHKDILNTPTDTNFN
jgi:hypothetical protein